MPLMEHIKKYLWIYILVAAILAFGIWYLFIRKKTDKTEPKKLGSGGELDTSIYDAKKSLEEKILDKDYITSIGTRSRDSKSWIQVGVKSEKNKEDVNSVLEDGKWMGYKVDITVEEPAVPQQPVKQKWAFKTIAFTTKENQKMLSVKPGDKTIPDQFKQGKTIKLKIHQTPEYTYDISAKIIDINPSRESMLVEFPGKVSNKAFGEAEI